MRRIFVLLVLITAGKASGAPFTVDGSTIYASGGQVGIATSNPQTTLDVNGSAQFGSNATKSTFTVLGALNLATNAALALAGSSGNIVAQSSITASAFFGDGSHLTGIPGGSYHVNFSSGNIPLTQTEVNWATPASVSGSTIAITIAGGSSIEVSYFCPMSGYSSSSLFIKVARSDGVTSTYPMGQGQGTDDPVFIISTYDYLASGGTITTGSRDTDGPLSAGTYYYHLDTYANGGSGVAYLDLGNRGPCSFMVKELP